MDIRAKVSWNTCKSFLNALGETLNFELKWDLDKTCQKLTSIESINAKSMNIPQRADLYSCGNHEVESAALSVIVTAGVHHFLIWKPADHHHERLSGSGNSGLMLVFQVRM